MTAGKITDHFIGGFLEYTPNLRKGKPEDVNNM